MITDSQIAALLVQLYAGGAGFDHYEPGQGDHGICWAAKIMPEEALFLLRGSVTAEDWIRDFVALASPFEHQKFGEVHPGFLIGMDDATDAMFAMWNKKARIVIAGHSLGAGRASIAAAEFLQRGVPANLIRTVTFGQPKPGMQFFADYISGVTQTSYRNTFGGSHDIVTSLALTLPGQWYVHPKPLIDVSQAPANSDVTCTALHHMPLYAAALAGR